MATDWFNANNLPMRELHTDQFLWIPQERVFSAGTAMFGYRDWWLQKLYHNSKIRGIALRSSKTGDVRRFRLVQTVERYGRTDTWTFQSIGPGKPIWVVIYNDLAVVEEGIPVRPENYE